MLGREELVELEIKNNVKDIADTEDTNTMTISEVHARCLNYIRANGGKLRLESNLGIQDKMYRQLIVDYVDKKAPRVYGYYGKQDNLALLKTALYRMIVGWGQLTELMQPVDIPDSAGYKITEIRINDRGNIWYEKNGKSLRADNIELSEEELEVITQRLLEVTKKSVTTGTPTRDGRTKEGYRVSVVHGSCSHSKDNTAVIRKFNQKPMKPKQLIENHTFSVDMYKTFQLMTASSSSFVTIGPTGSGKTITNGIILRSVPNDVRMLSIENPVELPLKKYDESGRVINDVVQYEAMTKQDNPDATFTVEKAITVALRQSPHWLILGEARSSSEFVAALTTASTGHCFATSYHADTPEAGLKRYLTEYLKTAKEPPCLAMANICGGIKFIVCQKKLADGTRKVTEVAEVYPPKDLDSSTPVINTLYKFVVDEIVYDESKPGEYVVKEMIGSHKRVGKLSKRNQERFIQEGVSKERFAFLCEEVNPSEKQRYEILPEDRIPS